MEKRINFCTLELSFCQQILRLNNSFSQRKSYKLGKKIVKILENTKEILSSSVINFSAEIDERELVFQKRMINFLENIRISDPKKKKNSQKKNCLVCFLQLKKRKDVALKAIKDSFDESDEINLAEIISRKKSELSSLSLSDQNRNPLPYNDLMEKFSNFVQTLDSWKKNKIKKYN
jgi:hypothetical protein